MSRFPLLAVTAALVVTSPGVALAAPSDPAAPGVEPVLVYELSDAAGDATDVALEGVRLLEAEGPDATLYGDTAVAPVALLTAPMRTDPFVVGAVTWDEPAERVPDVRFHIRVLQDGEWTEWAELDADAPDVGPEGVDAPEDVTAGTEPYLTGGADGVQVQVTGDRADVPSGLRLHLIPAEPDVREVVRDDPAPPAAVEPSTDDVAPVEPEDGTTAAQTFFTGAAQPEPATATAAVASAEPLPALGGAPAAVGTAAATARRGAAPAIITRAGWGADERTTTWTPVNYHLQMAVVHHTAGSNTYTRAQSAGIVRGIWRYHAVTRGWNDIGYNYLVDKYGQVFEGRAGTLASPQGLMTQGAHALNYNAGSLGISALGNYTSVTAPQLVLDRMAEVIAWEFADAGIDVTTPSGRTAPRGNSSGLSTGASLPRIIGHRDVGATTCPGNNIQQRLPRMRTAVGAQVASLRDRGSAYHLSNSLAGGPADVAFRYGRSHDDVLVGDWNGDGKDTFMVRRGDRYHVRNDFEGGPAQTDFRYGRPDDVVLVGDWDGDGVDTLAVRRRYQYHIKNSVRGGGADRVVSYGRSTDTVLVGDWNGDGKDTFAMRRGNKYHFSNSLTGGSADVVLTYGRPDDVVLVGDWNGDGKDTLAVRRGHEYHIKNSMTGGGADVVVRYGRAGDLVLVGDWDGNGTDTLGVRRR